MANRAKSPQKPPAKSPKSKGPAAVRARSTSRSGASKASRPTKSASVRGRSSRKTCRSADSYVRRLDQWGQECLAKLRRVKFDNFTNFCKKEWKELAAIANRLNELAGKPPRRSARKQKLTRKY